LVTDHGHHILTIDNAIPDDVCDGIVETFEWVLENKKDEVAANNVCGNCTKCDCTRLAMQLYPEFENLYYDAMEKIADCIDVYKDTLVSEYSNWPRQYDWEDVSLKKYEALSDQGQTHHSDQWNISSSKRFLIFFGYLSTVLSGGHTYFQEYNLAIPAKKGSVLLFPPFWTHVHKGENSVIGDKYIIKSSLMYSS
tara:strand:- start:1178 stop:1762 length:585 start_codon:yes stop_codon:yes gene_type:complete